MKPLCAEFQRRAIEIARGAAIDIGLDPEQLPDYIRAMQIFRAYIADAAGAVTWASWIEAANSVEARRLTDAMRPSARVDLWSSVQWELPTGSVLEAL